MSESAARKIQKLFRGHQTRRRLNKEKTRRAKSLSKFQKNSRRDF